MQLGDNKGNIPCGLEESVCVESTCVELNL
jgi:hypothetical protein